MDVKLSFRTDNMLSKAPVNWKASIQHLISHNDGLRKLQNTCLYYPDSKTH